MQEPDDRVLVRRCLKGDQQAFEILLDRYQKPIYNIALRMVNDVDDAADLTQTVFLKAYENLTSFDGHRKFFSWLYRIAVNTSLNFLAQKNRVEALSDREVQEEPAPAERYEAAERVERLDNAILELQPEYRIVIVLKHFHDLSYDEIGTILDIPAKTVKSRLYTARQLLKEQLQESGLME